MAGCGTCPDQCSCVIVDETGLQYPGAGTADNPIVIPGETPWVGTSSDGSIDITPGDVGTGDGHAPDLVVNFCVLVGDEVETGTVLVLDPDDETCRPHPLSAPVEGEVLGRDAVTGQSGWVAASALVASVPYGVPMEFWGDEGSVPAGYGLADGHLEPVATNPNLFAVIGFNATGGVDPGGGMFAVPDKRGYVAAGRDNMGGTDANVVTDPDAEVLGGVVGVEGVVLVANNLPAHTHPLTVNNGGTGVSVVNGATGVTVQLGGLHSHTPSTGGRIFVTVTTATDSFDVATDGTPPSIVVSQVADDQLTNGSTSTDPGHVHTITDPGHVHAITDPGHVHTGTATANATTGAAVSVMQPTQFVNYILLLG